MNILHPIRQLVISHVIWFSERDGWGHLYLYDLTTGALKNQITSGDLLVRDIMHVDEKARWMYFLARGKEEDRDPYYKYLYHTLLDGSKIELLTPENADPTVEFSPSAKYFVDNFSTIDTSPSSVVRQADGQLVVDLETADINMIKELGWKPPKQFKVKARDDTRDVYGAIFYPTNFNPNNKYPVIDAIYMGPQVIKTPKQFPQKVERGLADYWSLHSQAEVGFIVVTIDGLGTPLNSKKFHDFSY